MTQYDIDVGDGLQLHAELGGTGPPVVLLHGFTGSTKTWGPLVESLGERYTTVAIDLPGHGRSSAPRDSGRYGLGRFADDLALVLDTLRLGRVALLGYSLGGRAALHFAVHYPARPAALVLESASPGLADAADRATRAAADAELADTIERDGIAAFVDRWEQLPLWASQSALTAEARAALRAQRMANDPRGLANSLRGAGAASAPDLLPRLRGIACPTLLVAGALDAKYVAAAKRMEAAMALARVEIVERAGHAVHLERPGEFAKLASAFLRNVPADDRSWT